HSASHGRCPGRPQYEDLDEMRDRRNSFSADSKSWQYSAATLKLRLRRHGAQPEASNRRFALTLPEADQVLETFGDQPGRRYPAVPRRERANSVETILLASAIPCFRQPVGI